jgi:hypothetical protein
MIPISINLELDNPLTAMTQAATAAQIIAVKFPAKALSNVREAIKHSEDNWIEVKSNRQRLPDDVSNSNALVLPTDDVIPWDNLIDKGFKQVFILSNTMEAQYMADHLVWLDEQGNVQHSVEADTMLF